MQSNLRDGFSEQSDVFKFSEGTFDLNQNSSFFMNGTEIKILKRQKSRGKPSSFLLAKLNPKDIYISSMYPVEAGFNHFNIDYKYVKYRLILTNDKVNIFRRNSTNKNSKK